MESKFDEYLLTIKSHMESWKHQTTKTVIFERCFGLSNIVFRVISKDPTVSPSAIIFRIIGGGSNFCDKRKEMSIFLKLSEIEVGPKCFGVTGNQRLEEFCPGRHPTNEEMYSTDFRQDLIKTLVEFHQTRLEEFEDKPTCFSQILNADTHDLYNKAVGLGASKLDQVHKEMLEEINKLLLKEEISWIESILPKSKESIVFCHNDLLQMNILKKSPGSTWKRKIQLIDFEYGGYNYRGYEIGNFLNETCLQYDFPVLPYFLYLTKFKPALKEIEYLAVMYLYFDFALKKNLETLETPSFEKAEGELIKQYGETNFLILKKDLMKEIKMGELLSSYYWAVWSVIYSISPGVNFDYLAFGFLRTNMYFITKEEYLKFS